MVKRVFLHIGQPKTGTTYLQSVLWTHRQELADGGLALPGSGHREHLWAALDLQDRPHLRRRDARAPGTFDRLCRELAESPQRDGLMSHEFMCGATEEQAARAVAALAPAEVHVVVTARHAAGMLSAGWQEMVKNGSTVDLRDAASDRPRSDPEFSWATWDLEGVLTRWGATVPAARVHVLPVPGADQPPSRLWEAFAEVIGVAHDYDAPERAANPSLGAREVELLRRVNAHLGAFMGPQRRGEWIRGYLAEQKLRPEASEPLALPPDLWEDCRARSRRAVALIRQRGLHVVGDLARLEVPEGPPAGRSVDSVGADELVEAAGRLVAGMLDDVASLTGSVRAAEEALTQAAGPARATSAWHRVGRRLRRRG